MFQRAEISLLSFDECDIIPISRLRRHSIDTAIRIASAGSLGTSIRAC
jgi:hypothetical protein